MKSRTIKRVGIVIPKPTIANPIQEYKNSLPSPSAVQVEEEKEEEKEKEEEENGNEGSIFSQLCQPPAETTFSANVDSVSIVRIKRRRDEEPVETLVWNSSSNKIQRNSAQNKAFSDLSQMFGQLS